MISQGQLTATTASQVLLPDNTTRHGFLVKSIKTNTDRVFLGFLDGQSATTVAAVAAMPAVAAVAPEVSEDFRRAAAVAEPAA
jgi:hypothetical protein